MRLAAEELARAAVLIERGEVAIFAAGARASAAHDKPSSCADLVARRRVNLESTRG